MINNLQPLSTIEHYKIHIPSDCCSVGDQLLVGSYPGNFDLKKHQQKIDELCKAGVRIWICLQPEEELKELQPYQPFIKTWVSRQNHKDVDMKFIQLPIQQPVSDTIIKKYIETIDLLLHEAQQKQILVYLHCKCGHASSGMITILLIAKRLKLTTTKALNIWNKLHENIGIRKKTSKKYKCKMSSEQLCVLKRFEYAFGGAAPLPTPSNNKRKIKDITTYMNKKAR